MHGLVLLQVERSLQEGDRQAAASLIEALAAVGPKRHRAVSTPRFFVGVQCSEEGFSWQMTLE